MGGFEGVRVDRGRPVRAIGLRGFAVGGAAVPDVDVVADPSVQVGEVDAMAVEGALADLVRVGGEERVAGLRVEILEEGAGDARRDARDGGAAEPPVKNGGRGGGAPVRVGFGDDVEGGLDEVVDGGDGLVFGVPPAGGVGEGCGDDMDGGGAAGSPEVEAL